MVYDQIIRGTFVDLRAVNEDDAEFILNIRQDPALTKYLPRLDIPVDAQKEWIKSQIKRKGDYYFIVISHSDGPIGTIRVYNINGKSGETGSLAIRGKSFENIEAKLLCDTFAFNTLNLTITHNIIKKENLIIKKLAEEFGTIWIEEKEDESGQIWLIGENTKERFYNHSVKIKSKLDHINNESKYENSSGFLLTEEEIEKKVYSKLKEIAEDKSVLQSKRIVDDKLLDSLGMLSLVYSLSDEFKIKISFMDINANNFNSIKSISRLIYNILSKRTVAQNQLSHKKINITNLKNLDLSLESTQKSVVQRIFEYSASYPNEIAIIANDNETTYKKLCDTIYVISRALLDMGIKRGDCIIVQADHSALCVSCFYAVHLIGAILVPVESNASKQRIDDISNEIHAKLIIDKSTEIIGDKKISYEYLKTLSTKVTYDINKINFPDVELPCEMVFTTGTTGKSKGVLMTHKSMTWYAYSVAKSIKMKKGNRFLLTTPLNHAGGLRRTHLSLANGCCMVYMDGMSDLAKYFNYIDKYNVTSLYLPPLSIRILLTRTGNKLSEYSEQIDFVYSSSSSLPHGDCSLLQKLLPKTRLYNAYEASETPGVCAYNYNNSENLKDCIGKANDGVEVKIIDNDGNITDDTSICGKICIKSKMNMKEYYLAPELTKSVMHNGWFVSNDLGKIDVQGNVYYCGRLGDVINIGGYKISPTDVEEVALQNESVSECICVESEDEYHVPYLKLLVVPKGKAEINSSELKEFMLNKLEAYKVPRAIEIVDEIAKTFNGKLNRKYYRSNID